MIPEPNQTYYYASPDGKAAGPVSEQELRRLLKEGVIRPTTNVLRKGEKEWRRLSDFLPPQAEPAAPSGAGRTDSPEQLYYYASPDGKAAGPVSEQELRRLLKEGVIRPTTNVLRKGENQWLPLGHILNDPEPPANGMDDYIGVSQPGKAAAAGVLEKEFMPTLKDAYSIAVKNALPIVLSVLLWVLTLWIPYINIGTTIALCTMPIALSRNQPISPTFIFDKRYRQFFGEFFLTGGMLLGGILAGLLFCGFPAIVIFVSWCLAPLLVLDKGCNASEALTLSNKYTYGNKLLIFILFLALDVSLGLLLLIAAAILEALASVMATVVTVLLAFILIPATSVGLVAAIYKRLVYRVSTPS